MQRRDKIVSALLHWFGGSARDLPWRHTRDPYAIWISEVMLQQTQVKTVIPYWERWMARLPDIKSLADVPEQQLLKLWEGLGYYSRARNLQKAATLLVNDYGGVLPSTADGLMKLPGIGRYTAGAIASIAFNEVAPILDGNVIRVLSRLQLIKGDPRNKTVNAIFWEHAAELVKRAANFSDMFQRSCGMLNEALMELGATICTPRQPKCDLCPLKKICMARDQRCVEAFPQLAKRDKATQRKFVACIFQLKGKVLVRQREPGVVNGGLWEFPNLEITNSCKLESALEKLGVEGKSRKFLAIKHTITRYRITLAIYIAERFSAPLKDRRTHWISFKEIIDLPFSSAHSQVRDALLEKRT